MSAAEKLKALEADIIGGSSLGEDHLVFALPQIVAVVEAAELAKAKQQEALAIIREQGFVFDDIGSERGNWKHLAFSLYTDLCEIESHTAPALRALEEALS